MRHFFKTVLGAFIGTLLALVALFFLTFAIIGAVASSGKSEPSVPKSTILKIDLSSPISDQARESFSFNPVAGDAQYNSSSSLLKTIRAIDAAAEDPAVKFIYLRTDNPVLSLSTMEELRTALVRFRASGKAIVSYSKSLGIPTYYMASVADKVILNTYADCIFEGMETSVMYYKDLIDHLGVDVQLIRHGKYKSAGEPFISNEMSPENREQYQVMLGTIWNFFAEEISSSRQFTKEDFLSWVDDLKISNAQDAKDMGLVDETWFDDQVEEYLCSLFEIEKAKDLKFTSVKDYAAAAVKPDTKIKDKVAVLYAGGEIVSGNAGNDGSIGEDFAKEIAKVRRDSSVKAVVLRVNSPGGVVQTAAEVEREIELLKADKPVIASYGDYAASGGYWISCNCNKIFSDKTTLTGSIGVFGIIPSFGRAIKKNLHVNVYQVATTKHGSMANGFQPLDDDEVAWMQNMIENTYTDFVGRVSRGRDIPEDRVDFLGQGRVWAGADALVIGLVDEIGGLTSAISYAALAADLDNYRVVEYPLRKSMMDRLTESLDHLSSKAKAEKSPLEKTKVWLENLPEPQVIARMDDIIVK